MRETEKKTEKRKDMNRFKQKREKRKQLELIGITERRKKNQERRSTRRRSGKKGMKLGKETGGKKRYNNFLCHLACIIRIEFSPLMETFNSASRFCFIFILSENHWVQNVLKLP